MQLGGVRRLGAGGIAGATATSNILEDVDPDDNIIEKGRSNSAD